MPSTTDEHNAWENIRNELPQGETLTNRLLLDEFISQLENEATEAKYRGNLEEFCEWLGKPLLELQRPDIVRFLTYLKEGGRLERGKSRPKHKQWKRDKLPASSRKNYLCSIRELWRHFARMNYTDRDPTFGIKSPKVSIRPGLTITADKMRRFLDAPGRERDRVQAHLLCYTAARSGQLRFLRWGDVDFEAKEIVFRTMKFDKPTTIPMHAELFAALRRWQHAQRLAAERNPALAEALADPDCAYVLLTSSGRQLTQSTIAKQVKWRANRVGIAPHSAAATVGAENTSRLSPHALRRSWATLMWNNNTPLENIAEVLNHVSVDTTRKHYAFMSSAKKRKTIDDFRI